ncbi:hypothetical protein ACWEKR_35335 [Nocardia sp. NPDC004573]
MSPHPSAGHLRGGLVGVLVGVLAVAAHGAAGGGAPGTTELTLLLLIAAGFGSVAGTVRAHPSVVAGLLGAGQLLSHVALSVLLGHDHAGTGSGATSSPVPTGGMLFAHIVATIGCATLIVLTERLYAAASGALRAILAPPRRVRIVGAPLWPYSGLPPYRCAPLGALGPRAPPVPA